MKLIICLDDRNGQMFNRRRQSRDRKVVQDILNDTKNAKLCMTAYSAAMFPPECVEICDEPWNCEQDDFAFVEETDPAVFEDRIEQVHLYLWNRHYPADLFCSLDFAKFRVVEETELCGSSHEKITKKVMIRGE